MKATIRVYGDKPITAEVIASLEKLGETVRPDNNVLHAARHNLLCAMYRDVGRFDDCMASGDQAISHYRSMGSLYGETFIYFHEGLACFRQGRMRDAESLYKEGFGIAVDTFGENSDLAAIGRAFLAELSYEKNRLHEARQYLDGFVRHIERADAWIDVYLAAYGTRMKLMWATGDEQEVERTLTRAKSTAINRGLARLGRVVELQRQELSLRQQPAECSAKRTPKADDAICHQIIARIEARTLLGKGEYAKASWLLDKQAKSARAEQQILSFISLTLLEAASRWLAGQSDAAVRAFESALSAAMFEGIKRPFIDDGALLQGVIREVSQAMENRRGNRLRDAFIAELVSEIDASNDSTQSDDHLLSPREREVLRYVMQGQSNREIAEAIPLSVNTVKFHLKNIFGKLGVSSRREAVSVAVRERLV